MNYSYNQLRYIELLKKKIFFNSNKQSFYSNNPEECKELVYYQTILRDQVQYNNKENYRLLIQKYQNGEFSSVGFILQFFAIYREDNEYAELLEKNDEKILLFEIDPQSYGFSDLLTTIFEDCDALNLDPASENIYGISERQFRNLLEENFLQMQKYFC